jgi:hypothetical protein
MARCIRCVIWLRGEGLLQSLYSPRANTPPLPTASLGSGSHAKRGDFRGLKSLSTGERELG